MATTTSSAPMASSTIFAGGRFRLAVPNSSPILMVGPAGGFAGAGATEVTVGVVVGVAGGVPAGTPEVGSGIGFPDADFTPRSAATHLRLRANPDLESGIRRRLRQQYLRSAKPVREPRGAGGCIRGKRSRAPRWSRRASGNRCAT